VTTKRLRPGFRTYGLIRLQKAERSAHRIRGLHPPGIAPPIDIEATLRILDGEEDNDQAQRDASIEGSRQDVVVTHPPSEVESTHEEVENEAHKGPRRIIDSCGGRHGTNTSEADWDIDKSPERQRESTSEDVKWYGTQNADCEEPQNTGIGSTGAKYTVRANTTPDQRSSGEYVGRTANKPIFLVGHADIHNVT